MSFKLLFRLLVVDDDDAACAATAGVLESLGHRVRAETESLAALTVFSENPDAFDLAIVEPMLPELTGLELARRFKHVRPGFPILFYAGHADESLCDRIEVDNLGSVVSKPLTLHELAAVIQGLLPPGVEYARPDRLQRPIPTNTGRKILEKHLQIVHVR